MKKKGSSWPLLAHSGSGQETTFYLRVALGHLGLRNRGSWQRVLIVCINA